jgi:hypothetical protein
MLEHLYEAAKSLMIRVLPSEPEEQSFRPRGRRRGHRLDEREALQV